MMIIACPIAQQASFAIQVFLAFAFLRWNLVAPKVMTKCRCPLARKAMCAICVTQTIAFLIMACCKTVVNAPMAWLGQMILVAARRIAPKAPIVMATACAKAIMLGIAQKVMGATQNLGVACRQVSGRQATAGCVCLPARRVLIATFATQRCACHRRHLALRALII